LAHVLVGAWVFVAAFTIERSAVASWNDIILGIIVILLAIGSADATTHLFPVRQDPARRRR
jgi:hypothetical protein